MTPSEVLTKLLKDKVQREHLCIGDTSTDTSAPAAVVVIPSKQCWLCGQDTSLRFRLKDLTSLCFRCFRTAYMALVLPRINSPARRQSDERFLDLIQHAQTDEREEAAGSSKAAVADAELDCSTPSPTSFILAAPPASQPSSTSALGRWVCSKCSLINKVCVQRCEACSAINDSQVFCGLCRRQCRVVGECGEKCTGEVPHVVWRCMGCYVLNTCDGDACINCRMEREWNCVHCSAKHSTKRIDGLRFCSTCRYDNTPDEVVVGQDNFFREQRQQPGNSSPPGESSPGDAEAVVFGVNDSETKAEMQRQRAIEENEKRLRRRLERLNITRNFQKSDGNCLFSALANQLFGNPRLHGLVRSLVIAYMRSNSADYRILFESDKEWNSYIERMRELGCWGDELCLNAASRCFGVNIHVITSDEARWHMIFQLDQLGDSVSFRKLANANTLAQPPEPSIGANTIALFLAYKAPLHYDDISPSPVPSVVLSDLLLPALQKRVAQQSSRSVPTPAAPSNSYKSAPHQQPPTGQPPPPANPPAARPSPQPSAAVTPPPNRMSSLPYRGPVGRSNSTTAVPPNPGTGLQQPGNQSPPPPARNQGYFDRGGSGGSGNSAPAVRR